MIKLAALYFAKIFIGFSPPSQQIKTWLGGEYSRLETFLLLLLDAGVASFWQFLKKKIYFLITLPYVSYIRTAAWVCGRKTNVALKGLINICNLGFLNHWFTEVYYYYKKIELCHFKGNARSLVMYYELNKIFHIIMSDLVQSNRFKATFLICHKI